MSNEMIFWTCVGVTGLATLLAGVLFLGYFLARLRRSTGITLLEFGCKRAITLHGVSVPYTKGKDTVFHSLVEEQGIAGLFHVVSKKPLPPRFLIADGKIVEV